MSLDNIINTVQSLSEEPNKLGEDEEANLYVYLTDKGTKLADVEKLLNLYKTNNAKLVYLKGLSKKSVSDARSVARAILTRTLLNLYKPVPNTEKTPDQYAGSGLIRFEHVNEDSPMGYLTAPYIWLWIFVEISHEQGNPILRDWEFADYGEQKAFLNPVLSLKA
ncbi:1911_t:CDS:2, partial [Acaulospora morrowiae]